MDTYVITNTYSKMKVFLITFSGRKTVIAFEKLVTAVQKLEHGVNVYFTI